MTFLPRTVHWPLERAELAIVPFLLKSCATPWLTKRLLPTQARTLIMRSGCLWLLGVPLPIIIILWLITGHP
jgi:hypothetical protein